MRAVESWKAPCPVVISLAACQLCLDDRSFHRFSRRNATFSPLSTAITSTVRSPSFFIFSG